MAKYPQGFRFPIGPDVYEGDGNLDFHAAVKHGGIRFAAIRTHYGTRPDTRFHGNWRQARAAGIKVRIAWQYALPTPFNARAQARAVISVLHGKVEAGDCVALDLEQFAASGRLRDTLLRAVLTRGVMQRWVDTWCREIATAFPHLRHLGYAGSFFRDRGLRLPHGWEAWVPVYGTNANPAHYLPHGATTWRFHQFTDGQQGDQPHSLPGLGHVDINRFNGTTAQLLAWAGVPIKPKPKPKPAPKPKPKPKPKPRPKPKPKPKAKAKAKPRSKARPKRKAAGG